MKQSLNVAGCKEICFKGKVDDFNFSKKHTHIDVRFDNAFSTTYNMNIEQEILMKNYKIDTSFSLLVPSGATIVEVEITGNYDVLNDLEIEVIS